MKNLCAIIFCVIFVFLFSSINIINAKTYEQQLKPYKDLKDYDDQDIIDLLNTAPISKDQIAKYCSDTLQYLTEFYMCIRKGENPASYILTTDFDAEVWRVLQTLQNGILISTENAKAIVMIEGKFNVFDGQQFSKKHYLLKYVGTYKYIDTLDSNKSVPKLKLLKELK